MPVDLLMAGGGVINEVFTSLSGAAATFTNVTDTKGLLCSVQTTQADCLAGHPGFTGPDTITLTVLPTAAGTVTANTTLTATTNGSDSTSTTISVPTFPFTGFQAPVQNPPTLNQVNAGQAIPMKFSLAGDQGLNIIASGYPTATEIDCGTDVPINMANSHRHCRRQRPAIRPDHRHLHLRVEDRQGLGGHLPAVRPAPIRRHRPHCQLPVQVNFPPRMLVPGA